MFQIWAKAVKDGKIIRQFVYQSEKKYVHHEFFAYAADICYELDSPTPVVLKTHVLNFAKFNFVKFTKKDFIDEPDYDSLVLERLL
ncbi:MAG: hypothetical protein ACI4U2_03590 [Christensenellaceae bacterium]